MLADRGQLQRFREALDSYADQSAANALRLLMLTGSRKSEVLKAEWEQFDLQRGLWTKPRENTKSLLLTLFGLSRCVEGAGSITRKMLSWRVEAAIRVMLKHFSYCCRAWKGSLNQAFASSAVRSGSNSAMA